MIRPKITWEKPSRTAAAVARESLSIEAVPSFAQPDALTLAIERLGVPSVTDAENARQEAVGLLQIAAEVEHAFALQYLYAAYSIDKDSVGARGMLVKIAVEEMGHLCTIQNILLTLDSLPYFYRESAGTQDATFPLLGLRPLSLDVLGRFAITESPLGAKLPAELTVLASTENLQRVGIIYAKLYWLFQPGSQASGPWVLPGEIDFYSLGHLADSDFADPLLLDDRLAKSDAWGMEPDDPAIFGESGPRILPGGPFSDKDSLRQSILSALYDVAAQGEGPVGPDPTNDTSHFGRLIRLYQSWSEDPSRITVRPVVSNPTLTSGAAAAITEPKARYLAAVANARYQMLVTFLQLAIIAPASLVINETKVRETAIEWAVYDEMSTIIKKLSSALVRLPIDAEGLTTAGPPFEGMSSDILLPSTVKELAGLLLQHLNNFKLLGQERPDDFEGLVTQILDMDATREAILQSLSV